MRTSVLEVLLALFAVHTLMLGVATVVSVFKPWGPTWFGRRKALRPRETTLAAVP